MPSRLDLHKELCTILGNRNVYYSPPASVLMKYPCIKYSLIGADQRQADDRNYKITKRYEIIVIDKDPESAIPDAILEHFQMCSFDREYISDNLNHSVLTLYY